MNVFCSCVYEEVIVYIRTFFYKINYCPQSNCKKES